MSSIGRLTRTDTVNAGDVVPVYLQNTGDARGAALSVLQQYMQDNLTFPDTGIIPATTQYASPSSTGFSIQVTGTTESVRLIITPTAPFASGTIVLPLAGGLVDKQTVLVTSTQNITSLSINQNGATGLVGAPTTMLAGDSFELQYDIFSGTWFSVSHGVKNPVTAEALAANVAAFLAAPSSANLLAALTDETGTGSSVFATSPQLVTPNIGAAVAASLQRGAVVTKTISFSVAASENWIRCNGAGSITVTLPTASSFPGREIMIKTVAAQTVVSASANVEPRAGGALGTAILAASAGAWATLVSDGSNWIVMAGS